MIEKTTNTYWVKIYLSGPVDVIEHLIRRECLNEGLCVTITQTKFIYTGGEETGVEVGIANYPRFPKTDEQLEDRAIKLAIQLLYGSCQHSVMIQTPTKTRWYSIREENK